MTRRSFPRDPRSPDLAMEPVIAWRMWRIERRPDGGLALMSPLQQLRWQPMEPAHATCSRYRAPDERCSCGLYAASTPERLRAAGVASWSPACCVIGTVAMWGRVVEHQMGCRGELAYPDRIRLVCAGCFTEGRKPDPSLVWGGPNGEVVASCGRHQPHGELLRVGPAELRAELLSVYAVDLLPLEVLGETVRLPNAPLPVRALATQARKEVRQIGDSWVGWLMALAVVGLIVGAVRGADPQLPAQRVAAASAAPALEPPSTPPVVRPREHRAERRRHRRTAHFGVPCGHVDGTVVALVGCSRRKANVLGAASAPHEPRRACQHDGYTRKPRFSVCWFEPLGRPDPPTPPAARWWLPGVHHADIRWIPSWR